jgi:hypothetical protein
MSHGRACAFPVLAVATVLALPANGQTVISTHSGVVHFFEGAVYLGDTPLEPHLGKYPSMAEGSELRTAQGRAEVLLTPGVFLRMGESSAIRLLANNLADTRVELLAGSAIVDSEGPISGTSVTLLYKDWRTRFLQKGIYRIDSEPSRLLVREGEAEVSAGPSGTPVCVKQGMYLPFAGVLVPELAIDPPANADPLAHWAYGRSESIAADNAITAQIDEDPASRDPSLAMSSFTNFPLIGLPYIDPRLAGVYSSINPYQSGFSSIYLPGYTYRPFLLGLMGFGSPGLRGYRGYVYTPPRRTGFSSGPGVMVSAPSTSVPRPVAGAHPIAHPMARGGHR